MNRADIAKRTDVDVKGVTGKSDHKHRCLAWAGQYSVDWEILAYYQDGFWEACFFKWDFHHEHASGASFEDVRTRAEQRIDRIENERSASAQPASLSRGLKPAVQVVRAVEFPEPSNPANEFWLAVLNIWSQAESEATSRLAQPRKHRVGGTRR